MLVHFMGMLDFFYSSRRNVVGFIVPVFGKCRVFCIGGILFFCFCLCSWL